MKIINVDDIKWQEGVFVNPKTGEPTPIIHKIATIEMLRDWQEEVQAIPLAKIKQAREEVEELATEQIQVYDEENHHISCVVEYVSLTEVRELLDKLIESEG